MFRRDTERSGAVCPTPPVFSLDEASGPQQSLLPALLFVFATAEGDIIGAACPQGKGPALLWLGPWPLLSGEEALKA